MRGPLLRAAVAAVALVLLAGASLRFGREVDAGSTSPADCLRREPLCVGETIELGYVRVLAVTGGVVEVRQSAGRLRLHGLPVQGLRPGVDEVSVLATWQGGGDLAVQRWLHHPHRWMKKFVSGMAVLLWFGALVRRRG